MKELLENFKQFVEGEVLDFMAYKNAKNGTTDGANNTNLAPKNEISVTIGDIKVISAEGPINRPWLNEGEVLSASEFQDKVWAADYICQALGKLDKVRYQGRVTMSDGNKFPFQARLTLGQGKDATSIELNILKGLGKTDKEYFVTNEFIYQEDKYITLLHDYEQEQPQEEKPELVSNKIEAKNYGAGKTAADVEVGDILCRSWGYSMTIVDFYRVTKRTKSSIQIEELEYEIVDGNGMQGSCVPINVVKPNSKIEKKNYRILDYGPVCKIDSHGAYYWSGTPKAFDHLD